MCFKYFCYKFGKDVKSVKEGVRDGDCVGGYVGVEDKMLPSAGSVSTSSMSTVLTVVFKKPRLPPAGYLKMCMHQYCFF